MVRFDVQKEPATIKTLVGVTVLPCYSIPFVLSKCIGTKTAKNPTRVLFTIIVPFIPREHVPAVHRCVRASIHHTGHRIRWCPQLLESTPVSESCTTAAVRPTPEEPLPLALTDTSATCMAALSNCDLAVPGSPTSKQWMSPLRCIPDFKFCSLPPSKRRMIPFLMVSCPRMDGARELASTPRGSGP